MRNVHIIDIDAATSNRLIEIARIHCKLVLEFGHKNTSPELREEIKWHIDRLRRDRDALIANGNHVSLRKPPEML